LRESSHIAAKIASAGGTHDGAGRAQCMACGSVRVVSPEEWGFSAACGALARMRADIERGNGMASPCVGDAVRQNAPARRMKACDRAFFAAGMAHARRIDMRDGS